MALINGGAGAAVQPGGKYANYPIEDVMQECSTQLDRIRATVSFTSIENIGAACRTIDSLASNPALAMVGIVPTMFPLPPNAAQLYPLYERCEALKIPVRINQGHFMTGMPGSIQHPVHLDSVLIDFPNLVVIACHMGHPWESTLINYMRLYDNLYLANTAYLANEMEPEVIRFLKSDVGRHRMIFGTASPLLPLKRALDAVGTLDLDDETRALYLGGNILRLLSARDPALANA
jgi:predicted TIM-barrel fold metal-dependent hydrolase